VSTLPATPSRAAAAELAEDYVAAASRVLQPRGTGDDTGASDVLEALVTRPAWHAWAACRSMGSAAFFPQRGESCAEAKAMCATCPVQPECQAAGLGEKHGIWGGHSERERRAMRRRAAPSEYVASQAERVSELEGRGLSPRQIAEALNLSKTTVDRYRHHQRTEPPEVGHGVGEPVTESGAA
jgi:WhiB family redox-sensing transcriptional regulator